MEYKQTSKALVVKAITLWWWWGVMLLGIPILIDVLQYKRNKLTLGPKMITIHTGVITQNSREIPFSKIQSVTVNQSVFGQVFGYGHIHITSGNEMTPITFKYVDNPQQLKAAIQDKIT